VTQNERLAIVGQMTTFGGAFIKTLAQLLLLADDDNTARIEAAWPEYMAKYRKIASKVQL
jgi:hypothetical protein